MGEVTKTFPITNFKVLSQRKKSEMRCIVYLFFLMHLHIFLIKKEFWILTKKAVSVQQ